MSQYAWKWQHVDWLILFLLLIGSSLLLLPALGSAGILTSEAYYSSAAREMLQRNELITPFLNFKPFYEKPILTYWLIISSYKLFGVNAFSARLPSALCAIASVITLFSLARQFLSRRAACFSAVILACTPLFLVVGHTALTDMPLTFFMMSANLMFLLVLIKNQRRFAIPGFIALALAILCKGPIALVMVACCIGGYLIATCGSLSEILSRLKSLHPIIGMFILLAIALPWFVFEHFATHGEFTKYFFIQQNFGRISGNLHSHIYPWWFYIPFLLGGFFPWSLFSMHLSFFWRVWKKRFVRSCRLEIIIASVCWFIGILLLLLLAGSKLPSYLLPIAPPFAILVGVQFEKIIRLGNRKPILWTAPLLLVSSFICMPLVTSLLANSNDLLLPSGLCAFFVIAALIVYAIGLFKSQLYQSVIVLLFSCSLACAFFVPIGLIEVYRRGPAGLHKLFQRAQAQENASVSVIGKDVPSVSFYSTKPIFELQIIPRDCTTFLSTTHAPHYVIVETQFLPVILRSFNNHAKIMDQIKQWNLLLIDESAAK
jgi:4-amino-4-deoxy-L-arabinose transferase-like glycosyltransferase